MTDLIEESERGKGGRPPFEPTDQHREDVEIMAAMRTDHDRIAKVIGITRHTLYKYFREELDNGATKLNVEVAKALLKSAKSGSVRAQSSWLDRMSDVPAVRRIENTGPNGGPMQINLTTEQLAAMPLEELNTQLGAMLSGGNAE